MLIFRCLRFKNCSRRHTVTTVKAEGSNLCSFFLTSHKTLGKAPISYIPQRASLWKREHTSCGGCLAHFRYLINVSSCLSVNVSSPEGARRIGKKNTIKSILNMLLLDANSVECGKWRLSYVNGVICGDPGAQLPRIKSWLSHLVWVNLGKLLNSMAQFPHL